MKALSRKVSLKTTLALLLILTVFFSTTIYYVYTTPSAEYVVSPFGMIKTAKYIIYQDGSTYYSIDGTTGIEFTSGTNKATVQQDTLTEMTEGLLFLKGNTLDGGISLENDEMVLEEYQGQYRVYSNQGKFLMPQLISDPSTSGWGTSEEGRWWYNTADNVFKYWNGTHIANFEGPQGPQGPQGPAGPSGGFDSILGFSYLIFKNSTATYLQNSQGQIEDYDTDSATVFNWAEGNLSSSGGLILVADGEYYISSTITHYKYTDLVGASRYVRLTPSTNLPNGVINIDATQTSESIFRLANFYIDMKPDATQYDGNIVTGQPERGNWVIEDMMLWGVAQDYCALDIKGMRSGTLRNIYMNLAEDNATGIRIRQENTADNEGEFYAEHIIIYGSSSRVNCTGIDIAGANTHSAANIAIFDHCHFAFGGSGDNIGIKIVDDWDISFHDVFMEAVDVPVYLEGTTGTKVEYVNFYDVNFLYVGAGSSARRTFHFVGNVRACNVFGGHVSSASSGYAIYDESTSTANKFNQFFGVHFYESGGGDPAFYSENDNFALIYCGSNSPNQARLEYQTDTGTWDNPTGPVWNGRLCMQVNFDQTPSQRLMMYSSGTGWDPV